MAQDELNDFKQQIETGERKMETLASLYSDDWLQREQKAVTPLTAQKNMDPAFVNNAFRLREARYRLYSNRKFGYHIIQMESRAGDDANRQHIFAHTKDHTGRNRYLSKNWIPHRSVLIGYTMGFGEAVSRQESEDENAKFTGAVCRQIFTMDQSDKDMVEMLAKVNRFR